jgi:hypothetical protein
MVVVQQPSQTLTASDGSAILENLMLRHDQPITKALMIAFGEIQLSNTTPILESPAESAIPGTHGTAGMCGCMPVS